MHTTTEMVTKDIVIPEDRKITIKLPLGCQPGMEALVVVVVKDRSQYENDKTKWHNDYAAQGVVQMREDFEASQKKFLELLERHTPCAQPPQ